MPAISTRALVETGAKLAADVRVGAFSYIGPEVEIASGCVIENSVTITGKTVLGRKNHIFPMAVVGTPGEGIEESGRCILGEANMIREHVTVYSQPGRETRIGNDNLLMIGCVVGSGARIDNHGIFDNCCQIGSGAHIGDYVRTSGFSEICPGVTVGVYTFVTGYASVDRDAPPYAMMQGFPVRVRGVNTRNLKRCGFDDGDIRTIKGAFRELFNGLPGGFDEEALGRLLGSDNPHVRRLAEAVRNGAAGKPPE